MSDCCSGSCATNHTHKLYRCPVNGKEYKEVSIKTVMHHVKEPWNLQEKRQIYYFCEDPECEVVYFGQDDSTIENSALRTPVGIKDKSGNALVCYCFGITVDQAATLTKAKAFVIEQTKGHVCECEARNPSGRCCLKYFPKS